MIVAAIPTLNLAIKAFGSQFVAWLAIAQPAISLLVFAVAIYLANKASCFITKYVVHNNRFFIQVTYLAILALLTLFAAVAIQPIRSTSNILNLASSKVEVASSHDYQKNVFLGERNVALGGGGYVTGIYLHPIQKDLVYIKTDVGGFYRWNPGNNSWVPLTEQFSLAQSNYYGGEALVLDPNNPNIVYIATGAFTANWWTHKGTIFKSTNRGETWSKLMLDLKMGGNEDLRWAGERLAIDPFNSKTIFFGSRLDGLWKSPDAGETWSKVRSFPGKLKANIGITAIAFNQQVSGVVYAMSYGDGIYQSPDTGLTWSKIAGSPSEIKRIVVASSGILYTTHSSGVSKYSNGAWSDISPFSTKDAFNAISANPANPQELLVCTSTDKST